MFFYWFSLFLILVLVSGSLFSKWSWLVEIYLVNSKLVVFALNVFAEKQGGMFILTVLGIFTMVYLYSFSYMSDEVYLKRFLAILTLFATSMCVLILSSSLFSSLIGWDGLGVSSLFLILFYYSKSTVKAGSLTFLMNRVGDCFFILAITQVILMGESQLYLTCSTFSCSISLLIILTSITKSAQIPFSTWLPAAMEAPTPVSALVHSSTLVTAGIYLLYRYKSLWVGSELSDILMILSISTCFMASMSALVESDLKKLIALSTLSQLGFIMFSFSINLTEQGFTHMLMHAYFKALLFMSAGMMIHSCKGVQSITSISFSARQNPLLVSVVSCSFMSMIGFPFLAGFYSKDGIIDALKESNWTFLIYVLLIFSFMLTTAYCTRVVWYLSNNSSNFHSLSDSEVGMMVPMISLALMATVGGSTISWVLVEESAYFESSKVLILGSLMVVVVSYWWLVKVQTSSFLESKWGLSVFNTLMSNFLFHTSLKYSASSDMEGVPEIGLGKLKEAFNKSSKMMKNTMVQYSGNIEVLVFLLTLFMMKS